MSDSRNQQLKEIGLENPGNVYWNLANTLLIEESLRRHEGILSEHGALVIKTVPYTGRLPKDKFIVREPTSEKNVCWGKVNIPFDEKSFEALNKKVCAYLQRRSLFVEDCYAGADTAYRIPIRVVSERAYAALFAQTMFIREAESSKLLQHEPQFTVIHAPNFHADPEIDGTHSDAFIILHFGKGIILIGGTGYCGEIKKSIFTVMNYLLPLKGIMAMHCSANYGRDPNDTAIFFGLSGTGKTTLSATRDRTLIGDDEHGWSDNGVFNFEGGCYAKVIRLSGESEPEIYATTRTFGTLLENVVINPQTRKIDLDNDSITENTRASYEISRIENMTPSGMGGHPSHIIMLTADAFGVLPPISKLTPDQAMYHFLSGYTAKVAGTEAGIKEPQATFSPCFGAPFMALPPSTYANLLGKKISQHKVDVWLINTGWTGGPYGVGKRILLHLTRAMVKAVLEDHLTGVAFQTDPIFGLNIPKTCPHVPAELLTPRFAWTDFSFYDQKAKELAFMFDKNFKEHASDAPDSIKKAGPKI